MKIRNKITLWIVGAGLLAGILFSVVISYEILDDSYELLDEELKSHAHSLLTGLIPYENTTMLDSLGRLYWFKVLTQENQIVYSSSMTKIVDLPLRQKNKAYNINTAVPPGANILDQDDNAVTFRVRFFIIPFAGHEYLVQIARPMDNLKDEIVELIISITIGLLVYTIALFLFAYFVAGKILNPISDINTLALQISGNTLNKRIPLGKNQDELYTLSSSLNQMFDRLQFSFQRQKEFIANASHELKTPLFMQRLFFNEAQQRIDLPEDFLNLMEAQTNNLYRMERLVKNLLDLSALDLRDSLEPTNVDLTKLIKSVLQEYDKIIKIANIKLIKEIQENIHLQADEEKFRRVLINLIDNAIKYNSGEREEIRFNMHSTMDLIIIKIYNTGQGIPSDKLKDVFNQFFRLEKSRASGLGGSGLGLTIVRRIIELHHGRIEITSEYGHWAQVSIYLMVHQKGCDSGSALR